MISYEKIKLLLLHIIFPNRCLLCNEVTLFDVLCCDDCQNSKDRVPIGRNLALEFCDCYAPYFYSGGARDAVLIFKFNQNHEKLRKFSITMVRLLINNNILFDIDVVSFVPKYKDSKAKFNSSYQLAKEIARIIRKPVVNALIKIRKTEKQHHVDADSRKTNLIGAFDCYDVGAICNKTVLLVDDVCTTGNTFNICSEPLIKNGAKKVIALSATISRKSLY